MFFYNPKLKKELPKTKILKQLLTRIYDNDFIFVLAVWLHSCLRLSAVSPFVASIRHV